MATKRQVEAKLRTLIRRLDAADRSVHGELAHTLPDARTISLTVPDLEATYWTEMSGGHLGPLQKGAPPHADIRVSVSSDDLVALVDGRASLFSSYMSGRTKIEASIGDMMRLRKLA